MVDEIVRTAAAAGVDLAAYGLAWARVLPTVVLVPAFGLRALPTAARGTLGLALAAAIFPALAPNALDASIMGSAWPMQLLVEMARGLPVAIAAAVPLWGATMIGGVVDSLRGAQGAVNAPVVESGATPLGVPLLLLASALFLAGGGPARVVTALAELGAKPTGHPVLGASMDLVAGLETAIALAAPLLVASLVIEVAGALIARAAAPSQLHATLAPLRALAVLAVLALTIQRLGELLARWV